MVGGFDHGADDIGAPARSERLADRAVGDIAIGLGENVRGNAGTGDGALADYAHIEIAVYGQRKRARDGRSGHHEQVGTRPFGAQRVALVHAKAMLLVDDHKRELPKHHVIRQHGMGPEQHLELARCQAVQHVFTLGGGRGAGEQGPRDARPLEKRAALVGILLREDARRGHDAALRRAVGNGGKTKTRDGGLSRSHVAQKQAIHDTRAVLHVPQDIRDGSILLVGERKRQDAKRLDMSADSVRVGRHVEKVGVVSQTEGELKMQELIIGKAAPGLLALRPAQRKMNRAQRSRSAHETPPRPQGGRQVIGEGADTLQGPRHDATHPPTEAPSFMGAREAAKKAWASVSALYASWVGGSANMAAMQAALPVDAGAYSCALALDTVCYSVWIALLLLGCPLLQEME